MDQFTASLYTCTALCAIGLAVYDACDEPGRGLKLKASFGAVVGGILIAALTGPVGIGMVLFDLLSDRKREGARMARIIVAALLGPLAFALWMQDRDGLLALCMTIGLCLVVALYATRATTERHG